MIGTSTLVVNNAALLLRGSGALSVVPLPSAHFVATSSLSAESTNRFGRMNLWLPPISVVVSDKEFGQLTLSLPYLSGSLVNEYVPLAAETLFGLITPIVFSGVMTCYQPGEILASFPAIGFKASDHDFGEVVGVLPTVGGLIASDPYPNRGDCYVLAYFGGQIENVLEHIILVNESGGIIGTISGSRSVIATAIESMTASDSLVAIGDFLVSFDQLIHLNDGLSGFINGRPNFPTDGTAEQNRVWVANIDTGATSQYDRYGFNSFMKIGEEYYGVAEDGIYRLEDGDDDAGLDIESLLETGRSMLGTTQRKRVVNVYVGVGSSGRLLLKVEADGREFIYEARNSSELLSTKRFDIGRGLSGGYYNFTLMNQDSDEFAIEQVSFEPIILSRKI